MKKLKIPSKSVLAIALLLSLNACKSRKAAQKPYQPPVPVAKTEEVKDEPAAQTMAPASTADDNEGYANASSKFNFKNIQFEFNSAVLKTSSYEVLDQVSTAMKQAPSVKFVINGHSSAEGTETHNLSLSVDRANAVKAYLVNADVEGSRLTVKGFGESMPLSKNNTEAARALNRRVEIKPVK